MSCKYIQAWIGKCNKECNGDYCEEHVKEKCCICGKQATHGCDNTQFLVCGAPLCNNPICDTIHEVMAHGWDLKEFMDWTGRHHTEDEIKVINEHIAKKEAEHKKILENLEKLKNKH